MVKLNHALPLNKTAERQQTAKYWQMLVNLPNETQLVDISTGRYYKRSELLPLYQHNCAVQVFAVRASQILNSLHQPLYTETVYAKFLRIKNTGGLGASKASPQ